MVSAGSENGNGAGNLTAGGVEGGRLNLTDHAAPLRRVPPRPAPRAPRRRAVRRVEERADGAVTLTELDDGRGRERGRRVPVEHEHGDVKLRHLPHLVPEAHRAERLVGEGGGGASVGEDEREEEGREEHRATRGDSKTGEEVERGHDDDGRQLA